MFVLGVKRIRKIFSTTRGVWFGRKTKSNGKSFLLTVKYEGLKCKIDYTSILLSNHFQKKRTRERVREREREAGHLNLRSTPSPSGPCLSPPIEQSSTPLPICPVSLFLPLPAMSPIYHFSLYPCRANHRKKSDSP